MTKDRQHDQTVIKAFVARSTHTDLINIIHATSLPTICNSWKVHDDLLWSIVIGLVVKEQTIHVVNMFTSCIPDLSSS